jgi:phosphatidylglycerophosphatase A
MKNNNIAPWKKFFGSFFYVGRIKGGGTYTSIIAGFLLYYFPRWDSISYAGVTLGVIAIAILLSYDLEKDYSWFTLDELAGMVVTLAGHAKSIPTLIIGLIVFRLLDIFKLPFLKRVESAKAGIVLDDIIAGLLANVFLWIIRYSQLPQ